MTRHPVLVKTSCGRVAGVVHEPDAEPVGAVVLLHGGTGRSGPNRVWARLAESLASNGFIAFRTDDRDVENPGQNKDQALRASIAAEVVGWFGREAAGIDLLLVGRCMGARVCISCAAGNPSVTGIGLIAPRFHHLKPTRVERAGGAVGALKRGARRVLPGVTERVARSVVPTFDQSRLDADVIATLADIHCDVWILLGEGDRQWLTLFEPETRPPELAKASFEIVPETVVHANRTLRSQEAVIDRVTAWAMRCAADRERAQRSPH